MLRLAGVPLFLWLVLGPEADGWALVRADGLGRHRLPRRLPRPQAQPDARRSAQILDPVADRLYILAVVVGLALRDIIPWWLALSLPLRDLLLWGLVPLLRTRGYSALPVHFLGKAATFNLLYAFPLLLLGDGDGTVATAGRGLRLGVRALGHRALLVGRGPLRLAGAHAAARPPSGARRGERRCLRPRRPDPEPLPDRVTMPLLDPDHPASRSTRTTCTSPERRAAGGGAPPAARPRPPRRGRSWSRSFGLLVALAAVQTARNADVAGGQPRRPDRPDRRAPAARSPRLQDRIGALRRAERRPAATSSPRSRGRAGRRPTGAAARPRRSAPASSRSAARAAGHRRRRPRRQRGRPGARDATCSCWSTGCGRPAPRRSRSTATGSPRSRAIRELRHRDPREPLAARPRRTSSRRSATRRPCRRDLLDTLDRRCSSTALADQFGFVVDHGRMRTSSSLPGGARRAAAAARTPDRRAAAGPDNEGGRAVIAALGLARRASCSGWCCSPTCPLGLEPVPADRGRRRPRRGLRRAARLPRRHLRRQGLRRLVRQQRRDRRRHRLPRRQARRRRPAVDRRHRRPRDPDLLQRRRDPTAPVPCLTPTIPSRPRAPAEPGRAAPTRPATGCAARCCGPTARPGRRRGAARRCSASPRSPRCASTRSTTPTPACASRT